MHSCFFTGLQGEKPWKGLKQPIRVTVGGVECFMESQYISNYDFLEDELVAWNTGGGPGGGPDLIIDDGGDATLLIHKGVKAKEEFAKTGKVPYPSSTDNAEFQIVLNIIKEGLSVDPLKYHNMKEGLVMRVRRLLLELREPILLGRGDLINDDAPKKPMDGATVGDLTNVNLSNGVDHPAGPIFPGDIITDDLTIDNVTEKLEEKIDHPSCILVEEVAEAMVVIGAETTTEMVGQIGILTRETTLVHTDDVHRAF
ncbi:S-adenosyl-L-homocysteine hydrolase [Tanacetum coccineum]